MIRRKFLTTSIATSSLPLAFAATAATTKQQQSKALFEIRTYEIKFGANQNRLKAYLKDIYQPAILQSGATQMMMFNEWGQSDPAKLWVLISYPDAASYLRCQMLGGETSFQQASKDYDAIGPEEKIYNRYTSSLLLAFDGMPNLAESTEGAGVFELRTYEGYSEDAVRRKIGMFNKEEIDLFLRVKLNPVFFGEMISGPYRPSLVYMLHFKDMEERNANWDVFRKHPDWAEMRVRPEYAHSVSNIRKQFLIPA